LARVVEERRRERQRVIDALRSCVSRLRESLGSFTMILFGSFARGDFNAWSDVDVLVVLERAPENPLKRLELVEPLYEAIPWVEPIVLSVEELAKFVEKDNPVAVEALSRGVVIVDDLGIVERFSKLLNAP